MVSFLWHPTNHCWFVMIGCQQLMLIDAQVGVMDASSYLQLIKSRYNTIITAWWWINNSRDVFSGEFQFKVTVINQQLKTYLPSPSDSRLVALAAGSQVYSFQTQTYVCGTKQLPARDSIFLSGRWGRNSKYSPRRYIHARMHTNATTAAVECDWCSFLQLPVIDWGMKYQWTRGRRCFVVCVCCGGCN